MRLLFSVPLLLILSGCHAPMGPAPRMVLDAGTSVTPAVAFVTQVSSPKTGVWELAWQVDARDLRPERVALVFGKGGSVEIEGAPSVSWPTNFWKGSQVDITPFAGPDLLVPGAPSQEHYRLTLVSATEMTGTVRFKANRVWRETKAIARWVAPIKG